MAACNFMICVDCDNEHFFHTEILGLAQEYHGEEFIIKTEVTVCDHCGYGFMTPSQGDELVKKTKAAFADKHKPSHPVGCYKL